MMPVSGNDRTPPEVARLACSRMRCVETLVVGSGSLGSLIAARLGAAGAPVTLFGRPSPHLTRIASRWLTVEEPNGSRLTVRTRTGTYGRTIRRPALVIVAVKSWATEEALRPLIPALDQAQAVLTLQNGLGNARRIRDFLPTGPAILTGVTTQGAWRVDDGVVRNLGPGETWIGDELDAGDGAAEVAARVSAFLAGAGWPATSVPDIRPHLWRKQAIEAALGPITALTRLETGEIGRDPNLAQLAAYLATETAEVAAKLGIEVEDAAGAAVAAALAAGSSRTSMLLDIEAGRRTETDAITGRIHELGEELGVNTPVTTMLTMLMYALERGLSNEPVSPPPPATE